MQLVASITIIIIIIIIAAHTWVIDLNKPIILNIELQHITCPVFYTCKHNSSENVNTWFILAKSWINLFEFCSYILLRNKVEINIWKWKGHLGSVSSCSEWDSLKKILLSLSATLLFNLFICRLNTHTHFVPKGFGCSQRSGSAWKSGECCSFHSLSRVQECVCWSAYYIHCFCYCSLDTLPGWVCGLSEGSAALIRPITLGS